MGRSDTCNFDGLTWDSRKVSTLREISLTDKWGRPSDIFVESCGVGCAKSNFKGSQNLFWTIPCESFGSNLVTSYGSSVSYKLDFDGSRGQNNFICASIRGSHSTYFSQCSRMPKSGDEVTFDLHENTWMQTNNKPVTRERFMMLLAQCKKVSIRASFNQDSTMAKISNVKYEKASNKADSRIPASTVEICSCPVGYEGTKFDEINDLSYSTYIISSYILF